MPRWIVNFLCLLSLVVFVTSVALWVRSRFVGEEIDRTSVWEAEDAQPGQTRFVSHSLLWSDGSVAVVRDAGDLGGTGPETTEWNYERFPPHPSLMGGPSGDERLNLRLGGSQFHRVVHVVDGRGWVSQQRLVLPLWIFLPTTIPPALWLRARRRKRGPGFPVETISEPTAI